MSMQRCCQVEYGGNLTGTLLRYPRANGNRRLVLCFVMMHAQKGVPVAFRALSKKSFLLGRDIKIPGLRWNNFADMKQLAGTN